MKRRATPGSSRRPSGPAADLRAGRAIGAEGFVALDFETATSSRASACAVAVATVKAGRVDKVRRWLIRPPGNEYDSVNIEIHKITPELTSNSPSIAEAWPEMLDSIGDLPLVAHSAAFDMSVLRSSLAEAGSDWPDLTYFCTCELSMRAWPGRPSYRLVDIADSCGIAFQHHEPGADATAAAGIAIACCGQTGRRLLSDASRALHVVAGSLLRNG